MAIRAERETERQRTEAQLRAAMSRLVADTVGPAVVDPLAWFPEWAKKKSAEVAPATAETYKNVAEAAARFFAEAKIDCMADIASENVEALRNQWNSAHSTGTANHKLKVLRIALQDAWRAKIVPENVAAKVPALRDTSRSIRRDFRPAELERLLQEADPTWKAMILLGLYTGQRMGDLATLQWRNVDLAASIISTVANKTGATIILPIVRPLAEALEALPSSDDPAAHVFPGLATTKKSSRSNAFAQLLFRAGLGPKPVRYNGARKGGVRPSKRQTRELGFHSLRHTATTLLKAAGVSDAVARSIVGHESAAISKNYTHMPLDTMRQALEKIVPAGA